MFEQQEPAIVGGQNKGGLIVLTRILCDQYIRLKIIPSSDSAAEYSDLVRSLRESPFAYISDGRECHVSNSKAH